MVIFSRIQVKVYPEVLTFAKDPRRLEDVVCPYSSRAATPVVQQEIVANHPIVALFSNSYHSH